MGVVFKALDRYVADGRVQGPPFVAVKVVNTEKDLGEVAIQAIRQEGERLRNLRDDNIVAMKEVERDADLWFLVMELLEGEPLDAIIKRYPDGIPLAESSSLIEQLCKGVGYLHKRIPCIVHSDLKPSNVFVIRNKQVKILDFGISDKVRAIGDSATLFDPKRWGALCPPYACLELWSGTAPDPRDDIYSVGCIAYELLSGKHPFNGASARDRARPDAKFEILPIAAISRRQNAAIRRALALHRADRTPTIGQFLAEFTKPPSKIGTWRSASVAAAAALLAVTAFVGARYTMKPATQATVQVDPPVAPPLAVPRRQSGGPPESNRPPVADPSLSSGTPVCEQPPSLEALDRAVSRGLEAQTQLMTDMAADKTQKVLTTLNAVAGCIREFNSQGYQSKGSRAVLSDADRILKQAKNGSSQ